MSHRASEPLRQRRARVLVFSDGYTYDDLRDIPHEHLDVTCVPGGSREDLIELLPHHDAYMCSLRIPVDAAVLEKAPRLKLIATPTTGLDHLDLELLGQRRIEVLSLKADRALLDQIPTTAELSFALLLTCARHLPLCFEATRQGRWERHRFAGIQLSGRTLGLVGLGRLGTMMARYGQAFGMTVIGSDPYVTHPPPGVETLPLDDLLQRSHFVSLHVHLTNGTRGLLGARELGLMRQGSILINTSRGALIDEPALIREMRAGRIAAAGLDVIDGEWLEDKYNHPLIAYSRENPRLYITPHVGGTSPDATRLTARFTFEKVARYFNPAAQVAAEA